MDDIRSKQLDQTIHLNIDVAWEDKRMNWLGMENTLRDILEWCVAGGCTASRAVILIDETIAAFTKRGNVFPNFSTLYLFNDK
jgi:hypothetical protein